MYMEILELRLTKLQSFDKIEISACGSIVVPFRFPTLWSVSFQRNGQTSLVIYNIMGCGIFRVCACVWTLHREHITKLQDLKHFTLATRKSQQREIYLSFVVQKVIHTAFKVFCISNVAMLFYKTDLLQNYPLVTLCVCVCVLSQNELDEQKIALAICCLHLHM